MKKIKIERDTIIAIIIGAIATVISSIIVVVSIATHPERVRAAFADGDEVIEEVVEAPEEEEKDDIATVFKENILPYVTSAGSAFVMFLIAIAPYIKLRGKYNSLQGMFTVMNKSLEGYKTKEGEFTAENFIAKMQESVIDGLKEFIVQTVTEVVKENYTDNTEALNTIQVATDTLTAQFANLTKAALLTWGEKAGVKEILTQSPSSQILKDLYIKYAELKKAYEEKNAVETAEIDSALNYLEGVQND